MDENLHLPSLLFSDFNIPEFSEGSEVEEMVLSITAKKTFKHIPSDSTARRDGSKSERSPKNVVRFVHNHKQENIPDRQYSGLRESEDLYSVAQFVKLKSKGFQDVSGLNQVKEFLKQAVIYPIKFPHLFNGIENRVPWTRALLYGAPGVGKTALMHAVAVEADLPLCQVSSADLTSAWVGETEKMIRKLFQTLGGTKCILVLDEVDALFRKRGSDDSAHCRRAATELLIQIDKYEESPMFLLCASNCPWDIDNAFLRRFQKRMYIPLPDERTREDILLNSISKDLELRKTFTGNETWKSFLDRTEGLTGCDLKNLVRSALMIPINELETVTYWKKTADGMFYPSDISNPGAICLHVNDVKSEKVQCRSVKMSDLWNSLESTDKTVTESCLKQFEDFMKSRRV